LRGIRSRGQQEKRERVREGEPENVVKRSKVRKGRRETAVVRGSTEKRQVGCEAGRGRGGERFETWSGLTSSSKQGRMMRLIREKDRGFLDRES